MQFDSKTALVTGGAGGIGRVLCQRLAEEGACVVVADIEADAALALARTLAGGRGHGLRADVTRMDDARAAVEEALRRFGSLDILANVAGWTESHPFLEEDEAYWDRVLALNLKGTILCARAALDSMVERQSGRIVNVSSDAGRVGSSGETVYAAAKAGVIGFTKSLAREVARHGITVNCVCPGPVDTPLLAHQSPRMVEAMVRSTPMRRVAQPDEIAEAILFFAGKGAGFITGQVLSVSGGLTFAG